MDHHHRHRRRRRHQQQQPQQQHERVGQGEALRMLFQLVRRGKSLSVVTITLAPRLVCRRPRRRRKRRERRKRRKIARSVQATVAPCRRTIASVAAVSGRCTCIGVVSSDGCPTRSTPSPPFRPISPRWHRRQEARRPWRRRRGALCPSLFHLKRRRLPLQLRWAPWPAAASARAWRWRAPAATSSS